MNKFLATIFILLFNLSMAQNILEIIATSDIHGSIFPIDIVSEDDSVPSLAHISTYINNQRNNSDREVLLLDNGDFIQGTPFVYYYNYINTESKNIGAEVFNYMGYDAMCMGNHDFECGHSVYDKFAKELNCPLMAANVTNKENGEPYFKPYHIFQRCNKKVAVLALTTPAATTWIPETLLSGLDFQDIIESANYWVKYIKKEENPDLIICLCHSGTDYNSNHQQIGTYKNENASLLLAYKVNDIDIIIAGHDHQGHNIKITNDYGNEVILISPTSNAKDFCSIEVSFQEGKKVFTPHVYYTYSLPIDYSFYRHFSSNIREVQEYFQQPIGIIEKSMYAAEGLFKDNEIVNLIHKVQLMVTLADISFAAPLSINQDINSGIQKRKDIFKLYKFDNYLYCMEFTGKEIKEILEFSYWQWFNQMKDKNDYLLRYKLTDNKISSDYFPNTYTPPYNYESAEGIIYTVDVSKPYGHRVNIISLQNGEKFDYSKTYKVAVNSYRGSGGGKLLTEPTGISIEMLRNRILQVYDKTLKEYICEWLEKNSPYSPTFAPNWKIIPEEWFYEGYKRESKYFF